MNEAISGTYPLRRVFLEATLGPVPGEKRTTFIAALNGGGFRFSSAYGEAHADLATTGNTRSEIGFMGPS